MRTRRARRMLFETLERREVFDVDPEDIGTIWETWTGNFLPASEFKAATPNYLTAPSTANDLDLAINYLKANAVAFGALANDFNQHFVIGQYTDDDTGHTHILLQQKFNGLPVADAYAKISVDENGQVIAAGANFVRNIGNNNPPVPVTPAISAIQALEILAQSFGKSVSLLVDEVETVGGQAQKVIYNGPGASELSNEPIPIELHYVPRPGGGVELAWKINGLYPDFRHQYEASVGAMAIFRVGQVIRLADNIKDASYLAFRQPIESPIDGPRSVALNPHSLQASPLGWHDTNQVPGPDFFDLRGNNAFVREDLNGDVAGGTSHFPQQTLDFNDFFIPYFTPASAFVDASMTNVFYWTNLVHDITWHHGFREPASAFQLNNPDFRGLEDDPMVAFVQSPAALNNAFYIPTAQGRPSTMVFGMSQAFAPIVPLVDIAMDSEVVVHEYTHGISIHLTGSGSNMFSLDALQSGGMGEGWGDWLGLILTIDPGDTKNTPREVGLYSFGGIRRQPYSFDMAIDPLTLDDFNGLDPTGFPNSEVHNAGEIWASALWDMAWLLIERYGFDSDWYNGDGGNNIALKLVLEAMKIQPVNPSFTEARDAILAADLALFDSANFEQIWAAFSRRGFGFDAFDGGGAPSDVVVEGFAQPNPLNRVSGRVIEDKNGNGQINTGEMGLAGWIVYVDADKDGVQDVGERFTTSAADGSWSLPLNIAGTFTIREVLQPGFRATNPASGSFTVTVGNGSNITGKNFLNQQLPGGIRGTKFNDLDGNGQRDPGEPGIAGIVIYVDLNKDGKIGVMEPAATTDANGNYVINNVKVGADYHVREVARPGLVQIFPDPTDPATLGGAHVDVDVVSGAFTSGINFGNQLALDFGDAPTSYGTTLASNGPRHGVMSGYGLTLDIADAANVIDADANGLVHSSALGDDNSGIDDENGVQFLAGLVPGTTATVRVGVRTGGFSPAYLQAWVDFNGDGQFGAGEKIIADRQLREGIHDLSFPVPANAELGLTFARFRYGFERGLGHLGAALGGEVEDHTVNVLQDQAIAVDDIFPDRTLVPPDDFIKLNSDFADPANQLNVLRNDFGTSTDPTPEIRSAIDVGDPGNPSDDVEVVFTTPGQQITTAAGGTIRFVGPTAPLQYKPKPGFTGVDSFRYRVTAGGSISNLGNVTITVSPSDPVAVDDILRIPAGSGATDIFVLDNDLAALGQQISITGDPTQVSAFIPQGLTLTRSPAGDKLILNRTGTAATTFTGTVRFAYTIDDTGDPSTDPSTAVVTIQITPGDTTPAASHLAIFRTRYLRADSNGDPILGPGVAQIFLADSPFFWVELVVQDPVGGGSVETIGVESAYIDMLIDSFPTDPLTPVLVEPVLNAAGTRFVIEYEPAYGLVQRDDATFSVPGTVQEIGATRGSIAPPTPPPTGNGEVVVMRVKFRANDGGSVIIQADHADSQQNSIALAIPTPPGGIPENPLQITDDDVFIHKAGLLQIVPDGAEGEFTNRDNVYDVNGDGVANQTDILLLINDLSQYGPRSLNQLAVALTGLLPPGYLDVNIDAQVNSMDILNLVNYLTARGATGQPNGEGEGGGASAAMPAGAAAFAAPSAASDDDVQPLGALVNFLAWQQSQEADSAEGEFASDPVAPVSSTADEDEPVSDPIAAPTASTTSGSQTGETVDSDAADELFASMSSFRERLRLRRLARG
jgi:hypothetical protein